MDDLDKASKRTFLGSILKPKTIFLGLAIILLVEVIIGVKTLLSPTQSPSAIDQSVLAPLPQTQNAKITLSSDKESYRVSQEVLITVNLTTGQYQSDGTDVVLGFDPQSLEPTDKFFEKGSLYQDYPGVKKDSARGTVSASGIAVSSGFSGSGVFGTFKFRAKKVGESLIELKFTKGLTTDSNIIESGSAKDLLQEGSKVEIKIL